MFAATFSRFHMFGTNPLNHVIIHSDWGEPLRGYQVSQFGRFFHSDSFSQSISFLGCGFLNILSEIVYPSCLEKRDRSLNIYCSCSCMNMMYSISCIYFDVIFIII